MFSIIISEKGGAERTEGFDKGEINVGRVQGNDLVLPKGNVSKHHARLLFRDGRFIVTDLKSTNGTYVNGRKIAQATIVREGDKIYIGDFVLRLESSSAIAEPPPPLEESSQEPEASEPPKPAVPAVVTMKAPSIPPGAPSPRPQPSNVTNAPPPLPPLDKPAPGDETSAAIGRPPRMPPSPAAVGGLRGGTLPLQQGLGASPRPVPAPPPPPAASPAVPPSAPSVARAPEAIPSVPPAPSAPKAPPPSIAAPPSTRGGVSVPPPAAVYRTHPPRSSNKDAPAQAARRLAMTMLMGRIADAVDLSPLNAQPIAPDALASQIERVAREQAEAMRAEEEAPAEVDLEALARDAHRELVGTGPLAALLEDDEVSEIHVSRFDRIDVVRGEQRTTVDGAFTSDEALKRAIARLVAPVGGWPPGEALLDRRLARAHLVAVAPPSSSGHAVSIRKRAYLDVRLELLAASGTLSKPMEQFLEACIAGHVNVLVSGNSTLASSLLLSALTALSSADERVCVAQDTFDLAAVDANAVHVGLDAASIRAAARLHAQRLVIAQLTGTVASAAVDAIADGATGVVCGLVAPTLRQGLTRLAAQLVLHRPALTLETARELVAELFDVAIEVNATPDGRTRVLRIAELGTEGSKGLALRDLFTFSDAGDGTFAATGTAPRLAADLASRGIKLDPALFKRGR